MDAETIVLFLFAIAAAACIAIALREYSSDLFFRKKKKYLWHDIVAAVVAHEVARELHTSESMGISKRAMMDRLESKEFTERVALAVVMKLQQYT